jgi:hypothetical protein
MILGLAGALACSQEPASDAALRRPSPRVPSEPALDDGGLADVRAADGSSGSADTQSDAKSLGESVYQLPPQYSP